ncbi:hypothetical protein C8R48DRAFT_768116 [Suillus tomentosus]|nr:hypothetical protein C8R48DRAFT_768116 [Suillus tomentosus]
MSHMLSGANATRHPPIRPAPRQVPPGFFDHVQDGGSSSTHRLHPDPSVHRLRNAFVLSGGSRSPTFTPELKNKLSGANTTRRPPIRPASCQVPPGFFDNVQDGGPSSNTHRLHPDPSLHRRRSAFAPPWGSRPRALLVRLTQRFHRFQSNAHEDIELQQRTGPGTSSRSSPPVVDVPALDDKKALYIARRPQRASDKAKRVDNLKWWAHVVLFLCCASPSNDDGH